MWPFSRKANPASRVILLGLNPSEPVRHKNYYALAKASYQANATVFGCIGHIAVPSSTVPWVMYEKGRTPTSKTRRYMTAATRQKSETRAFNRRTFPHLAKSLTLTEVSDHKLLSFIEHPNPAQAQSEYLEQLFSYWLLSGNEYEYFISPLREGAAPMEAWNLRPDRVEIMPSGSPAHGLVSGYRYTVDGRPDDYAAASVLHHKFFHPTDDFYGMSPLEACATGWQTSNLGSNWNYSLLKQGARPSGAIVAPTTVGDDVYDRLKKELAESYQGAEAAGLPMFMEGGMEWKPMGLTPLEMDFLNGLVHADVMVCRAYRVAPEIAGVPGAKQYNSYAEARTALWHDANMPLLDRLRDSYNQQLVPRFGDRLYLDYDRDQIDAIQEDQAKVFDKLNRTRFISTNEKRVEAGFDTYDDPVADIPESIMNPTPGATGQPGVPDNTVTSLRSALRELIEADETLSIEHKQAALATLDGFDHSARTFTAEQLRDRKRFRALLQRHFRAQGSELSAYLKKAIGQL